MEKLLLPWGAPVSARDLVCETPAFRLQSPTFSRERSYDRTVLRFAAPGERTLAEASYEVNNVYALLLDANGRLIVRRSHDSGRQLLVGPQCMWSNEFYDDQLERATSVLYEVETRVDLRRTLFASPLSPVDFDSEARQPWVPTLDPIVSDRLMQLSVGTCYNRSELEIWLMATSACVHEGHRSQLEVALLDAAGATVASKWMSLCIDTPGVSFQETSIRMEKRVARSVASLELRGRSEVRVIARIGPLLLDQGSSKPPTSKPAPKN